MPPLDHVAVVVSDLERTLARLPDAEAETGEIQAFPSEGTREVYVGGEGASARLLIMEPHGSEGPYARALESRGPGLHHIAFHLEDVDAVVADPVRRSNWLLHPATLRTWERASTVWLKHPDADLLVELHEAPPPADPGDAVVEAVRAEGLPPDDWLVESATSIEPGDDDALEFGGRWLGSSFFSGAPAHA